MGRYFNEEEIQIMRAVIANYEKRIAELEKINAALVAALERFATAEYADNNFCFCFRPPHNRTVIHFHGIRCTAARAAIALAKAREIDPVSGLPFNKD